MEAASAGIDQGRGITFLMLSASDRGDKWLSLLTNVHNQIRVAEWQADGPDNKLITSPEKLTQAHINVDPAKLYDALEELMNE